MSPSSLKLSRLIHRPPSADSPDGPSGGVGELLASSPGLTRVHWDECRRLAPLQVPPASYPQGAFGLFRGQTIDYILAYAGLDRDGRPGVQYALPGTEWLRQVAGRVDLLLDALGTEIPVGRSASVAPLSVKLPEAPLVETEIDNLLDLTLMLKDNFAAIDALLAGVIQGVPVAIVRGPHELPAQVKFLKGLLTLLPIPARLGVTFATYARRLDAVPVQIAFLANETPPAGCLCYDWEAGELHGDPPEDPYSRYIVQQLRLDAALAVEHMTALTRTAGWRLKRGEGLAKALGWAAHRVALDAAVAQGMPADSEMVATVLREDPTLSDDLRVRYARHLLAFVIALDDPDPAAVIGRLARQYPDVADTVLPMLDDAIEAGKPYLVYRLVAAWLADPDGPEGYTWRSRAYAAAAAHLEALVEARAETTVIAFMEELQHASTAMMLSEAAQDLLQIVLPLAVDSADLANLMCLLAADHLPAAPFQRLLSTPEFVRRLPQEFQEAARYFQPDEPPPPASGMLSRVANAFGKTWALIVMARLVEWAEALERPDLIDTLALEQLAELAGSPFRARFETLLRHVVEDFNRPDLLNQLDPPGPRLLVEILLLLGDYRQIVGLLERISGTLFRGDDQLKFAPWVSDLFEKTGLDNEALLAALNAVAKDGIKPVPLAMAYRGALINKSYASALEPIMDRLSEALIADPLLVPLVGYEAALRLVQVHARRQDADRAASLAAVITASLGGSEAGLAIVGRLWTLLNWNKDVRQAALELLRRYVRQVPAERAQRIPAQIGRKLGDKVGEMLQATLTVTAMTGGAGFEQFAEDVHATARLLSDLAIPYENKPYPTLTTLLNDLDALSGSISKAQRRDLSGDLVYLGKLVAHLGESRGRGRNREAIEQRLIAAREIPKTGVDVLWWLGGFFADGQAHPLKAEREALHHVTGARSLNALLEDVATACRLLARLETAFPPDAPPSLSVDAFRAEVDSLWRGMRLYDQRRLREEFAVDAQALAALIGLMSDGGDPKALDNSALGRGLETTRREPKSALEVVRLISGYFTAREGG